MKPQQVYLQQCEDGLTLCIPQNIADRANLKPGGLVDVVLHGDEVLIGTPRKRYTLEELMEGMTGENRHPEWDTGPAVGREVW